MDCFSVTLYSQTSCSALTDITATNKNEKHLRANSRPSAASSDALHQHSGTSASPAHEMTHGGEEAAPQAERDGGDGAPLQVTLSQAGRWESHTNGSPRQELESVFSCHGYKLAWATERHNRILAGERHTVAFGDGHQHKARYVTSGFISRPN